MYLNDNKNVGIVLKTVKDGRKTMPLKCRNSPIFCRVRHGFGEANRYIHDRYQNPEKTRIFAVYGMIKGNLKMENDLEICKDVLNKLYTLQSVCKNVKEKIKDFDLWEIVHDTQFDIEMTAERVKRSIEKFSEDDEEE